MSLFARARSRSCSLSVRWAMMSGDACRGGAVDTRDRGTPNNALGLGLGLGEPTYGLSWSGVRDRTTCGKRSSKEDGVEVEPGGSVREVAGGRASAILSVGFGDSRLVTESIAALLDSEAL